MCAALMLIEAKDNELYFIEEMLKFCYYPSEDFLASGLER